MRYTENDIKRFKKLINWGISNNEFEFKSKKAYNPLFSLSRCFFSKQEFGFDFASRLHQSQLARLARVIRMNAVDVPDLFFAQKIGTLRPESMDSFTPIPSSLYLFSVV